MLDFRPMSSTLQYSCLYCNCAEGSEKGGDSEAGGTLLRLAVLRAWAELYIACESGWLDAELERHARKLFVADNKPLVRIGMF